MLLLTLPLHILFNSRTKFLRVTQLLFHCPQCLALIKSFCFLLPDWHTSHPTLIPKVTKTHRIMCRITHHLFDCGHTLTATELCLDVAFRSGVSPGLVRQKLYRRAADPRTSFTNHERNNHNYVVNTIQRERCERCERCEEAVM